MAVRVLLAALVGGLLLMVWGQFYWFVLPTEDIIHHSPEEQRLLSTMQEVLPASGVYILPHPLDVPSAGVAETGHRPPRAMVFYRTTESEPFDVAMFALGLLHAMVSAGLVALLLALAGPCRLGYWRRYGFLVLAGAAGSYTVEMLHFIWFPADLHFYFRMILFQVGGWLIAALAIARIMNVASGLATVREKRSAT